MTSAAEVQVLVLVQSGNLAFTEDGRVLHKGRLLKKQIHRGRGRYVLRWKLRGDEAPNHGWTSGTVYANRMHWIMAHHLAVPDGMYVDHKNGDKTDDRVSNLQLHSETDSHRQGMEVRQAIVLDQLCRWFEFVGLYGTEPETPRERSWVEFGF